MYKQLLHLPNLATNKLLLQQCRLYSRKAKERVLIRKRSDTKERAANQARTELQQPPKPEPVQPTITLQSKHNNKHTKQHSTLKNRLKTLQFDANKADNLKADNINTEQFIYNKPSPYASTNEHIQYQQRIHNEIHSRNHKDTNEEATGHIAEGNELFGIDYDVRADNAYTRDKLKDYTLTEISQLDTAKETVFNSIVTFIVDSNDSVIVLKRMTNKLIQMYCNIEHTMLHTFGTQTVVTLQLQSQRNIGAQQIKASLDRCLQSGQNSMVDQEIKKHTTKNEVCIKLSTDSNNTLPHHSAALQITVHGLQHPKLLVDVFKFFKYADIHVITCDITTINKSKHTVYTVLNSVVMMPDKATVTPMQLQKRIAHIEKTYSAKINVEILDEPQRVKQKSELSKTPIEQTM